MFLYVLEAIILLSTKSKVNAVWGLAGWGFWSIPLLQPRMRVTRKVQSRQLNTIKVPLSLWKATNGMQNVVSKISAKTCQVHSHEVQHKAGRFKFSKWLSLWKLTDGRSIVSHLSIYTRYMRNFHFHDCWFSSTFCNSC